MFFVLFLFFFADISSHLVEFCESPETISVTFLISHHIFSHFKLINDKPVTGIFYGHSRYLWHLLLSSVQGKHHQQEQIKAIELRLIISNAERSWNLIWKFGASGRRCAVIYFDLIWLLFFYGLMMNGSFDWLNSLSDLEVLLLGKRRGPDIEKCWVVYYR